MTIRSIEESRPHPAPRALAARTLGHAETMRRRTASLVAYDEALGVRAAAEARVGRAIDAARRTSSDPLARATRALLDRRNAEANAAWKAFWGAQERLARQEHPIAHEDAARARREAGKRAR